MKQHPIETLDPVFRWLDWIIARVWTLHLHGHGLAVAAAHCVDSEGWFLAQTTPTTARYEGSARNSTDQSNTAAAAGHHRRRTAAGSAVLGRYSSVCGLKSQRRPKARANCVALVLPFQIPIPENVTELGFGERSEPAFVAVGIPHKRDNDAPARYAWQPVPQNARRGTGNEEIFQTSVTSFPPPTDVGRCA